MPFAFKNLDAGTRANMVVEIEAAIKEGNLYSSKRFNEKGASEWPSLLLEAAESHDEHWLAYQLETRGLFKGTEGSHTPSGGYTIKHVPITAAETMAEGQFNRYYILGLCRIAAAAGKPVWIYRAKAVSAPRPASRALEGTSRDAQQLAEEVRPVASSLNHELLKPNSGLSVHL